ncbi:MAG TPA: S9 family peptidase [Woeseiaceae bacterium]|nr:S9 family peptidase [Woeseiaceae bacterium]
MQALRKILLIAIPAVLSATAATAQERFSALDVFQLEYASDPRISPDGDQVVYVRRSNDIMTDRTRGNLWIAATDGSSHRPLLSSRDSYSSPRWSADGTRIAYASNAEGSRQLYVRWMDTGQTALVTNLQESPQDIAWSPDGKWIAFSMHVTSDTKPLAKMPEKPEGAEWAKPVEVIEQTYYRSDGEGYLDPGYSHIFVVPSTGGTPRQLTHGEYNHGGRLSWMPDSKAIVFSANRSEDWRLDPRESDVFVVELESGKLTQLTDRDGPDSSPAVSPDGRRIAYVGFDERKRGYENAILYVMNSDGSNVRALTSGLDRSVGNPEWLGNGNGVFVSYDDHGVGRLAFVTLDGDISTFDHNLSGESLGRPYTSGSFSVAENGTYAFTSGTATRPADVAVSRNGRDARQLTALNADLLGQRDLARIETVTWQSSHDGLPIEGWIAYPPGYEQGKRYPFILEIHGGPYAAYGPNFSAEIQRYAAEGFVVLYANPRGSTSYGADFAHEIQYAYPGHDYDDLMSGVDYMIERGIADPERLFVTGGSGGGVLTAWIVGKTDRFRAAVVAKPVINWTSFVLTADMYPFFRMAWFSEDPWVDPEQYWDVSPLSLVGNVKTPTALMSGEEDYRTPTSEAEQFYQALKLRQVDTALIRVPGASHHIAARPSSLIAKTDNIMAWFRRYDLQEN